MTDLFSPGRLASQLLYQFYEQFSDKFDTTKNSKLAKLSSLKFMFNKTPQRRLSRHSF